LRNAQQSNGVFHIIPMLDELILKAQTPAVQSQVVQTVHSAHVLSAYSAALVILLEILIIIRLQRQAE
jgi:hypothetical protein